MPGNPKRSKLAHIIRGCGDVPHCGNHPGWPFMLGMIGLGLALGWEKGWTGMLSCAGLFLLGFGPVFLTGAYERSKLSDQLSAKEAEEKAEEENPG